MRYLTCFGLFFLVHGISSATTPLEDQCLSSSPANEAKIAQCEAALQRLQDSKRNQNSTSSTHIDLHIKLIEMLTHQGDFIGANRRVVKLESIAIEHFSPEQQFRFYRRKGILHYRQSEFTKALNQFIVAQSVAELVHNADWQAKALSDLGTTHSAMTRHDKALDYLQQSLAIKRQQLDPISTAITLNNIGNVHRQINDWQQAKNYYQQAIDLYQKENQIDRAAHTMENLALVLIGEQQTSQAYQQLLQSYEQYKNSKNVHSQLRLLILLARTNINTGDLNEAEKQLQEAQTLELSIGKNDQSSLLKLQLGRLISQQGQYLASDSLLLTGLQVATSDLQLELQIEFLAALANNASRHHYWNHAFDYQKQYTEALRSQQHKQYSTSLAYHRALLDYDEQNYQLNLINKENQIQGLELNQERNKTIILILLFSIALILFTVFFHRFRKERALEKRELQDQITFHRERVKELGINYQSLQQAFGQIKQPIIIVNNRERIIFANQAMYDNFNIEVQLTERQLNQLIPLSNESFWQVWHSNEDIDSEYLTDITLTLNAKEHHIAITVSTQLREESIGVIIISIPQSQANPIPLNALLPHASFHQLLVDLMNTCLQLWESTTQSTRLELAEQSGVWRVSIDDGRLRTRSLDRYLTLKTLPKKPRWREVVRTAHFVLAECDLSDENKCLLEQQLKSVSDHIRAESLM